MNQEKRAIQSSYGIECPVCHGTGWQIYTEHVEGYKEPIEFSKICPKCKGRRRMNDKTGIPPEYCNTDISKFDFSTYRANMDPIKRIAMSFVDDFPKWQERGKGLYFWSNTPGSGKTFLSCCLARSLMIKYGLQMVSILVTWALENAIETSDSMRSRGYGLHGRTAFSIYRLTRRDCFLGAVMGGLFAVFTVGCAGGAAYAVYDPRIVMAGFSFQGYTATVKVSPQFAIITYICFGIFCFIPVFLELYENWKLSQSRKQIGTEIGMTYRQIYEELDEVDFIYNNQEYKGLEQEGKSL